jgi:hypothetical protein
MWKRSRNWLLLAAMEMSHRFDALGLANNCIHRDMCRGLLDSFTTGFNCRFPLDCPAKMVE